jgi:hypothetical protein
MRLRVITSFLLAATAVTLARAVVPIGCGAPGMKVTQSGQGGVTIFRDEDQIVGSGFVGGFNGRKIEVIYGDLQHGYSGGEQLFPIDSNSAFTCSAPGWDFMVNHQSPTPHRWDFEPRMGAIYRIQNGQLRVSKNLGELSKMYSLPAGGILLGSIDGKVFYWEKFDAERVFCRGSEREGVRKIAIPKRVVDIFGVTRGIHKDFGFVTFEKSEGFIHYAPYQDGFYEFNIN